MPSMDDAAVRAERHLRTQASTAGLGDPDDHVENASLPAATSAAMVEALRELKSATAALSTEIVTDPGHRGEGSPR